MTFKSYNEAETMELFRKEGRKEGIEQARVESIRNLMKTLKLTAQQAMDALLIPAADQPEYLMKL